MKDAFVRAGLGGVALLALAGLSGPAFAFGGGGGGNSGSGLSPYAAESGNDRSAGVNNGNYRDPRYDPYIQAYGSRNQPGYYPRDVPRPAPRGYYGYPY